MDYKNGQGLRLLASLNPFEFPTSPKTKHREDYCIRECI